MRELREKVRSFVPGSGHVRAARMREPRGNGAAICAGKAENMIWGSGVYA